MDGGSSQMTYTTPLVVGKSGTSSAPITIRLAPDAGRNGQAVFFGGRSTPLPYCDQPTYTYQTQGVNNIGVEFGGASWVVLDGTKWSGISIHGTNQYAVHLDSSASNVTVRNVDMYDNGNAWVSGSTGMWRPDLPGVALSGSNVVFERDLIHDNGQDAFQSNGGISNITVRQSWLYNARPHPSNPSLSYNFCMHSDGMQVYNGGLQSGVTFDSSILGPGLMQGTLLGQASSNGSSAQVDNVTLSNVLILDTTNANIMGYPTVQSRNWTMQRVTSFHVAYDPDGSSHSAVFLEGSSHQIRDSIFYGGTNYLPGGAATSGNFQFNNTGYNLGTVDDPMFVAAPGYNSTPTLQDLINGDYALRPGSPAAGKGSSITSVAQLLGQAPSTPTPAPTQPASTATPRSTNTPGPTQPAGTATPRSTSTAIATATTPPSTPPSTPVPGTPTAVTTPCANSFSDVHSSDYFYNAVAHLTCQGVISGYSDGTFRPYNNTTRGQLSKIVVLAEGWSINTEGGPHFSDVQPNNTFYPYIETAFNHGVISGYADHTFRWGASVTRAQLSKIVVQAQGWAIDTGGGPHFSDVPASNPFYVYVETAFHHSVISGYSDGTFRPGSSATRGQIAKIVYQAVTGP